MAEIYLTDRAMDDLQQIYHYSTEQFGVRVADQYLDDIQRVFQLLEEQPDLLNSRPQFSPYFQFFPARKHWLVCSKTENDFIFILTIPLAQNNLIERLIELEPTLADEAEALHRRLQLQ